MGLLQVATVIVSVFILSSYSAPTRPTISEKFLAEYKVETRDKSGQSYGQGRMGRDPANNRAFFNSTYEPRQDIDYELDLYNEHVLYTIQSLRDIGYCIKDDLNAAYLPAFWGWLSKARYAGQKEIHHVMYDLWTAEEAGIKLKVGVEVDSSTPNIPGYFSRRVAELQTMYIFTKFEPVAPPPSYFIVPKNCTQSTRQFKKDTSHEEMLDV